MDFLRKVIHTLLDILLPVTCAGCGKNGQSLCSSCIALLPRADTSDLASKTTSLFSYRSPLVQKVIWQMKYKNGQKIAEILGTLLYEEFLEYAEDHGVRLDLHERVLLVPIPMSSGSFRKRGYNQAELIAQGVSKESGLLFELENSVLFKTKNTQRQALIREKNLRLKNIKDTFAVRNASKIKDNIVLLVDDVTTTGATLAEARKILEEAGARSVFAITVAH